MALAPTRAPEQRRQDHLCMTKLCECVQLGSMRSLMRPTATASSPATWRRCLVPALSRAQRARRLSACAPKRPPTMSAARRLTAHHAPSRMLGAGAVQQHSVCYTLCPAGVSHTPANPPHNIPQQPRRRRARCLAKLLKPCRTSLIARTRCPLHTGRNAPIRGSN